MNELEKPVDLHSKIVEKIKTSFVDFIPDEAWGSLVQKEVDLFIKADLSNLIKAELKTFFLAEVKKELETPEFLDGGWGEHGELPSNAVKQIIKELAPDFMQAIFGAIIQQSVMQMKQNLNSNMY